MNSNIVSQVETATSENLANEDWALILNLCDAIDKEPNGPKSCASALQRRIFHSDPKVIHFSLTLLDAIFKNCKKESIQAFSEQSFLDTLRTKLNMADTPVHLKPKLNELLQNATKLTPAPTPETVLASMSKVNELLTLLHSIPPHTSPTDHPTIQSLYQDLISLRPNLIQLLTYFNQRKNQLIQINDQLQHARGRYDVLMDQAIRTNYELYPPPPPPTFYMHQQPPPPPPNAPANPGRV